MFIKCKMCGGDMELSADQRTGICEYCGSTMTLPKVDDEQRAAAFNRGNYFRRIGEFDKALLVYESIVRENENDAEGHWCCALCRFGIEYVKDPVSGEYLPTCHRASFDSFLEDVDYKAALKYADVVARSQYQKDAEKIAQVQKGILSISQKEEPFDVFICYKESDERGNRTVDSTLAQDIYYQLTEQGRRVFFARVTLEDKAGQEYEPYIFAALHSAKVMVVVGTKPEYLNAVWVKNEWSRYLALMKKDRKRLLIPCYRDMDPYDLPEQLSVLQSYDMSKIGFIQDLIRGIAKILDADKKTETKVVEHVIEYGVGGSTPGIDSLMKRVYLFLEDGDFNSAKEYIERVLDIDPNYAPAYVARVCIALEFRRENQLGEATFQYDRNQDWKKALRFANTEQKYVYEEYARKTEERVGQQLRDYAYDCWIELAVNPSASEKALTEELEKYRSSCLMMEPGKRCDGLRRKNYEKNEKNFRIAVETKEAGDVSEEAYQRAAKLLNKIGEEKAASRARQCLVLAEQARQKAVYIAAEEFFGNGCKMRNVEALLAAVDGFQSVSEYKDAAVRAERCLELAGAIQKEDYQAAVDAMRSAGTESQKWQKAGDMLKSCNLNGYRDVEQLRQKAEKEYQKYWAEEERIRKEKEAREKRAKKQRQKKRVVIAAVAAAMVMTAFMVNDKVIQPSLQYKEAKELMDEQHYFAAYAVFSGIRGYKDVDQILSTDKNFKEVREIGNEVQFGQYEQDGNSNNGKEDIEWIVLAEEDGKLLLLSKYALDAKPYNIGNTDISWENSTIRKWLNQDFLNSAFTEVEQALILETKVYNSMADQIFLLSYKEAFVDYFTSDKERICKPTTYAVNQGAYMHDNAAGWWLRSPGKNQSDAIYVRSVGSCLDHSVDSDSICVRPALWIEFH